MQASNGPQIALVSAVGFAGEWHPLGIAILKQQLESRTNVRVRNFFHSSEISHLLRRRHPALWDIYCWLAEEGESYHELFYASKLFRHATPRQLLAEALADRRAGRDIYDNGHAGPGQRGGPNLSGWKILELCRRVHAEVERTLRETDWDRFALIGFSCLHAQLLGSAYMASELRRRGYRGPILLGGAMFRDWNVAQYRRMFPQVDKVVVGDGFAPIVESLREAGVPVRVRRRGAQANVGDFSDLSAPLLRSKAFWTPVQLSDGCSWSRCLFCAIPTTGRRPGAWRRVAGWIRDHKAETGCRRYAFIDWDLNGEPASFTKLLRSLAGVGGLHLSGMCNTYRMSRELSHAMKRAGFESVLLGVESFSDAQLARMGKQARVVDNVQAIKCLSEARIRVIWFDLITGFPGFNRAAVEETAQNMARIAHLLAAPGVQCCLTKWKFERDSKAFPRQAELDVRFLGSYAYHRRCYPSQGRGLAFHIGRYRTADAWKAWYPRLKVLDGRPVGGLSLMARDGGGIVIDRRGERRETALDRDAWRLYRCLCDRVATPSELQSVTGLNQEAVSRILARLGDAGLIITSGERCLGLATDRVRSAPRRLRLLEWF